MKSPIFRFSVIVVICLIGASFARGWITMSKSQEPTSHKVQVEFTLDPDKARTDVDQAGAKVRDFSHDVIQKFESKDGNPAEHHN